MFLFVQFCVVYGFDLFFRVVVVGFFSKGRYGIANCKCNLEHVLVS